MGEAMRGDTAYWLLGLERRHGTCGHLVVGHSYTWKSKDFWSTEFRTLSLHIFAPGYIVVYLKNQGIK